MKSEIVKSLSDIQNFSCTMDGRSSIAGDPYMTLSIHYLDQDWSLQLHCLTTMYVPASHTADIIVSFVREGLAEYNLHTGQLNTMTSDAAANNVTACKKIEVKRISCFGHILHNALNNSLKDSPGVTALLKAARKIVSVFSYSHNSRKKLEKLKRELKIECKALVQDVST